MYVNRRYRLFFRYLLDEYCGEENANTMMIRVTREDRMEYKHIRGSLGVAWILEENEWEYVEMVRSSYKEISSGRPKRRWIDG